MFALSSVETSMAKVVIAASEGKGKKFVKETSFESNETNNDESNNSDASFKSKNASK